MEVGGRIEKHDIVQERIALIDRIPMFRGLDASARHALASGSSVIQAEAGATVAMEGSPAPPVFFVLDGLVTGYRIDHEGRTRTLARLHAGDPFYLPCVLGKDTRAPVSTRAARASHLFCTPQAVFRLLIHEHPSLAVAALAELSNKVGHFVRLAGDVGVLTVRARVARLLLELAEGCDPPTVVGTHEDLAAGVGSVREVVSRHLQELSAAGLVRVTRGRVEIVNVRALRSETGR